MAETRVSTRFQANIVFGETKSYADQKLQLDRITVRRRVSSAGAELDRSRQHEETWELTPQQAQEVIAELSEKLMWLAQDALRFGAQLEAAGIAPEEA